MLAAETGCRTLAFDLTSEDSVRDALADVDHWGGIKPSKRFGIRPDWLAADTTYGTSENLGLLVKQRGIIPLILVNELEAKLAEAPANETVVGLHPAALSHYERCVRELESVFGASPATPRRRLRGSGASSPASRSCRTATA